jgi:predicted ribosome quality control (RQC) complex YloA/Tae2 family protein
VARTPSPTAVDQLTLERRARLVAPVRALAGATLQKLWLLSPAAAVLQFRVPGRTALVVAEARLGIAALAGERPTSAEGAPTSQATLRAALEGARLVFARLERAPHGRTIATRLEFETPAGPRSLIAGDGPSLLLVGPAARGERIVWAAAGAGPERRPGAAYRETEEVHVEAFGSDAGARDDAELLRTALSAEEAAGVAARRQALEKRLREEIRRLRRTLAKVDEDAARAAGALEDRRRADLLVPHQATIPRGAREARVPDWNDVDETGTPREAVVPLDPTRSVSENIARWFRRAQRYRTAASRIAARRAEVATALERAEALLSRAATVSDAQALAALEAEAARPEAAKKTAGRAREASRLPYRTFRSTSGARILVGRSARDNDALTFGAARGNDLWLHARGVQGSHVVVPDPGDAPDSRTLSDAALLATHFSRARGEDRAEVSWTRRKHVRKSKGAPAGSVVATQERVLVVRQSEARLEALLATEE